MSSTRRSGDPGWMLDEVAHAGRENLDAGHVSRYDLKEHAQGLEEVALLKDLGLGRDSLVVEIGAGTGQFSLAAASETGMVIAVDVSPMMLDRLRSKVAAAGVMIERTGFTIEAVEYSDDGIFAKYVLRKRPDAVTAERAST